MSSAYDIINLATCKTGYTDQNIYFYVVSSAYDIINLATCETGYTDQNIYF